MRINLTDAQMALLASFTALTISASGFYYQWWHEKSQLFMQIMQFGMAIEKGDDGKNQLLCTIDIGLFNSGNRDAALVGVKLHHGRVAVKSFERQRSSNVFVPRGDPPGYVDQVIKAGDIELLQYSFPGCTTDSIMAAFRSKKYHLLFIETSVLSHRGKRSSVRTTFANIRVGENDKVIFSLFLDGHFDLQNYGSFYYGPNTNGTNEMWFKKEDDGSLSQGYQLRKTVTWPH